MEKICGIYKVISPTKKVYIGQSIDINKRWKEYKKFRCKEQILLYHSLKKYGADKLKFEIINICKREQLNELEIYYISLYQCFDSEFGLNLQVGGNNHNCSDETKKKISAATKGKTRTEETKKKMSKSFKGRILSEETKRKIGEIHKGNKYNLGKHLSEETKEKIRIGNKGKIISDETRNKISKFHKGNKYRLGRHHSKETRNKMSIAHQNPSKETRDKLSKAGMNRKHSEKTKEKMSKQHIGKRYAIKSIIQCTESGIAIKEFTSIKDAVDSLNKKQTTASPYIISCLRKYKSCNTAYGFVWKYKK